MAERIEYAPLIEVIFEIHWELPEFSKIERTIKYDPNYEEFLINLKRNLKQYPNHIRIPNKFLIPPQIASYQVQHQFRLEPSGWPLIQIGPGIITINHAEGKGYCWNDFKLQIAELIQILFKNYPDSQNLKFTTVQLRYIDLLDINYDTTNVFDILNELKINIHYNSELTNTLKEEQIKPSPIDMDIRLTSLFDNPKGALHTRFFRVEKNVKDKIIQAFQWEYVAQSGGEDTPQSEVDLNDWAEKVHKKLHKCFYKMIEGKFSERLKNTRTKKEEKNK